MEMERDFHSGNQILLETQLAHEEIMNDIAGS